MDHNTHENSNQNPENPENIEKTTKEIKTKLTAKQEFSHNHEIRPQQQFVPNDLLY